MKEWVIYGLIGACVWFFFAASNLPREIPPTWTYGDRLSYRSYSLMSKFGVLGKRQEILFRDYIDQGLSYGRDLFDAQRCDAQDCTEEAKRRALEKLNNWSNMPAPGMR